MEVSSWMGLLYSISSVFSLSSLDCFDLQPERKIYQTTDEILKLLNPIVESISHSDLGSNDVVGMEVELKHLLHWINDWKELFENWNPLRSRVHRALKAELLTIRIQKSTLEVVRLLNDSCHYLPALSKLPYFERFVKEENSTECESVHIAIKEVIQKPSESSENCLGFRSNTEMLVEIVALVNLKNFEQRGNKLEVDYIDQLIALLVCKHDYLCKSKLSHYCDGIAVDFLCPLSLNLMENPVIIFSGQTFECVFIKKWFEMGITVCPITRQALTHTILTPDYTCKALISNWCKTQNMKVSDFMNPINDPFEVLFPGGGVLERDVEVENSVNNLKSDSVETQRQATANLLAYAKNTEKQKLIADYGGIRLLVNLLEINPEIQENVVTTLLYLAINHDNKVAIVNSNAIEPVIHVLQTGTPEAQENSAATLFCLSMIHECKLRIGRCEAIRPLVQLLKTGSPRGRNNAVITLFNLSIAHENRARIVQEGGVKLLVELINPAFDMVDKAVGVLESLARISEGRDAIREAGGIRVLVEVVELGSERLKEIAASTLLLPSVTNFWSWKVVLKEGCGPPLVVLAFSGTPRARDKARELLGYLRSQRRQS